MITRGYFIGEIVDAFADIAKHAEFRAKLGLTDQHVYVEEFFRVCLNHLYGLNLVNLNKDAANAPGLDLGDASEGRSFQLTTTKTSEKVNKTLEKIDEELRKRYPKVNVLVIGRKQSDYTLDPIQAARFKFTKDDIWDLDELSRRTMDLDIVELQALYEHVRTGTAKVKIELEVPDAEGDYPTTLYDHLEKKPQAQVSEFKRLAATDDCKDNNITATDLVASFAELASALARLPRMTRELLAIMVEERNPPSEILGGSDDFQTGANRLSRILRYSDLKIDLSILQEHNWIVYYDEEYTEGRPYWRISFPWKSGSLHLTIDDYLRGRGASWKQVLVSLDFSMF